MKKIRINQKKNEVLLAFNDKFYSQESIDKTITDFKDICHIIKTKEGILLKPKEKLDINVLGYEFYNYTLGMIKNR
jgi:hypothetical protein